MRESLHKIPLIIRREYLTRVRKKSFLVMTVLGPLLMAGMVIIPTWLSQVSQEKRRVVVVDNSYLFPVKSFKNTESITFDWSYIDKQYVEVERDFRDSSRVSILFIPENILKSKTATLNSTKQPGLHVVTYVQKSVERILEEYKMIKRDIDPDVIRGIKTQVSLVNNIGNEKSLLELRIIVGFMAAIIIYMFIFLYGAQVMRGVMEEKSSRIVEVIISSVKPFHLMMGKIIGVSLVGLTQFVLWIVLSFTVLSGVRMAFTQDRYDPVTVVESFAEQEQAQEDTAGAEEALPTKMTEIFESILSINWPVIIGMFIFFFLGGYLLYGSLFAAIGAAVDSETDTQQFMFPVSIPLIIGLMVAMGAGLHDPSGPVAYWFSLFPFTAPVVMMVRIPFGVHWVEIALSMGLLIAGFLGTTWIGSRIYRTGILMYGKKVSWREIMKWIGR